jgi:hypothetical protein
MTVGRSDGRSVTRMLRLTPLSAQSYAGHRLLARPATRPSDRLTVRPSDRPTVRPSDLTVRPSDLTVRPSDLTVRPSDRPTV